MTDLTSTERRLLKTVQAGADELVALTQQLVRIPSENRPPAGGEQAAQVFIQKWLADVGVAAELIDLTRLQGLTEHELFFRGEGYERREYEGRPNLAARLSGQGTGRSLVLSGHIDTMPAGKTRWRRAPFGGEVEGNRLYGRGSMDMKGGIAAAMAALRAVRDTGVALAGDVVFETVVDEEHGGANGTLANRLAGYNGDAAVIAEPSNLQLYAAHKGFRIVHLTLRGRSGMSFAGEDLPNPVEHVGSLIDCFKAFRRRRRRAAAGVPEYAHDADPVPVFMNKLQAGEFSLNIPMQIPETCTLEIYWQTMPGETRQAIDREFFDHLSHWIEEHPSLKQFEIEHRFSHRWMPAARTDPEEPIVQTMRGAAGRVLGRPVNLVGSPFPCDMFVFEHFGIPTVLFGPRGAYGHGSDEYVEIDSLVQTAQVLALTLVRFCGLA
jgi:acetylornithine deacetylase